MREDEIQPGKSVYQVGVGADVLVPQQMRRLKGAPRNWLVQAAKLPTVAEDAHCPMIVALLFPSGYDKDKGTR